MAFAKRTATVLLLLFCACRSFAQNDDCGLTLDRAVDEFNNGHFYSIASVLDPCLKQFTKEQSQRAYLLLTQTYLLLDDPIGAKQSYLSLLKANPEFLTDTAIHPIDVIYLSKKFTATSIFSWFGKIGSNITIPRVIYDLNGFGETTVSEKYKVKVGYQASVGGDLNLTDKFNLRGEVAYTLVSFKQVSRNYWEQDFKELTERQNWVSIPLTFAYNDHLGKYRPYGYLGYAYHYMLTDKGTIVLKNNRPEASSTEGDRENTEEESPSFDMIYKRNRFNQSVLVGGGIKIKVGLDFIFVDLRYNIGLKNITSSKGLYGDNREGPTSSELISTYDPSMRYVEVGDYLRLDNLSVSFGFLRPLYKPRELKKARTKSVMRQMKK
jgi:hypothetical protein